MIIFFGIAGGILLLLVIVILALKGINLCHDNDAIGVFLLFLALNIVGLVWGLCIISNVRYEKYRIYCEKKVDFLEKSIKSNK